MSETKLPQENESQEESENSSIFDDLDLGSEPGSVQGVKSEEESEQAEAVEISKTKLLLMKKLLSNIKESSDKMENLLAAFIKPGDESRLAAAQMGEYLSSDDSQPRYEGGEDGRVIEGVFDGENMIGPDGKQYSVPANYASKSKLVEGDILKLTITPTGTFVYKQIGPIERRRVVGTLEQTQSGNYVVNSDGRKWQVLIASVTYFKGEPGDEAVILVPKRGESRWAAMENVVKKAG